MANGNRNILATAGAHLAAIVTILSVLLSLLTVSSCRSAELRIPNAKVVGIHDGDTLWVRATVKVSAAGATVDGRKIKDAEIPFVVQIRLLDLNDPRNKRGCWAPELWQPGGFASRDSLRRMALGKTGTLIIDLDRAFATKGHWVGTANLSRMSHMSRYFGDFWVPGYATTVGRRQIKAGRAFPTKDEQERRLR